ncbi:MAG: hypothetical protein Solivirus1_13 [Solivirus sp.]|uniref:Tyrosine specific protein phosphatases domain-containing protein n=1 Tax=Solivirus sp. TaxID=2487772 RepID=A0A3G5AF65_9VIRU|nr:MAG: hypothetical protein Solivirus1_13 [Solivirus sp.]
MCDITICGLQELPILLETKKFDAVISINDNYKNQKYHEHKHKRWMTRLKRHFTEEDILCLYFEDVMNDLERHAPSKLHVERIIDFGRRYAGKRLLIHCVMGASRSPAAGIIVLRALGKSLDEAVEQVQRVRSTSCPNPYMLQLYDEISSKEVNEILSTLHKESATEEYEETDSDSDEEPQEADEWMIRRITYAT